MIRSMTAFAREESRGDWGWLAWELRSVNHRYLDLYPRLPEELRFLEPALRERAGRALARGKVECTLRYRPSAGAAGALAVNWRYAEQLLAACDAVRERLAEPAGVSPLEVVRTPGVIEEQAPDLAPVGEAAVELLEAALATLVAAREREGQRLAAIIGERARALAGHVAAVRERRPEVNREVRARLEARLSELGANPDPGRLEQELVFIAQRLDVDEELERLDSHLAELDGILGAAEPVGRRLDFLMQELNREANTLSAKAADAETTRHGVEMKVLIEQMREQVQNLE